MTWVPKTHYAWNLKIRHLTGGYVLFDGVIVVTSIRRLSRAERVAKYFYYVFVIFAALRVHVFPRTQVKSSRQEWSYDKSLEAKLIKLWTEVAEGVDRKHANIEVMWRRETRWCVTSEKRRFRRGRFVHGKPRRPYWETGRMARHHQESKAILCDGC